MKSWKLALVVAATFVAAAGLGTYYFAAQSSASQGHGRYTCMEKTVETLLDFEIEAGQKPRVLWQEIRTPVQVEEKSVCWEGALFEQDPKGLAQTKGSRYVCMNKIPVDPTEYERVTGEPYKPGWLEVRTPVQVEGKPVCWEGVLFAEQKNT